MKNLFRPSYGGNRNCALMYTLGELVVSSDDDMRPYALMEDSPESLEIEEVCRGRLVRVEQCVLVYYCQSLVREIDLADQRYTAVDRWSHPQTVKDVVATQCKRGRGTRQLKPGSHYAPLLRIVGWKSRYRVV